jgi:ribosomal protein L29
MKAIKSFTSFNPINEEFVPKKVTKESRNKALVELTKTLDENKKNLLSLLLLTISSFYASADQLPTLKRYNQETGTNLFPTTATEAREVYNRLCKGFDVEQFQLLTEVLSLFAKDLGIDSDTIGFNARVAKQALDRGENPKVYADPQDVPGYKEPEMARTGAGAELSKESLKTSSVFNRIMESINI